MLNIAAYPSKNEKRIAIIGGGIAGASVALCLSELGLDVTLLEKGPSLVNGPPICHLHAGGNLYREISEKQCFTLLSESIDLVRLYPNAVDYRPTIVAVPKTDKGDPEDLFPRLQKIQAEYARLIKKDARNQVLGDSKQYFEVFDRARIEALKDIPISPEPITPEQWMIPIAHYVDLDKLKFPLIMVQEYGLNLFRLAASAELALQKNSYCQVLTQAKVTEIVASGKGWKINYQQHNQQTTADFDFVINAAGFRSGLIDDMLGFKRQRLVEFKAAYVTKWPECDDIWPEVIFFGERGTPQGMAQFTPYPDGYFQLHGMTQEITLFNGGLVESSSHSAQPQLDKHFIEKIDKAWRQNEVQQRSQAAIDHLSEFIPAFCTAQVTDKPLYGAQQIPGDDADLRAAGVSFVGSNYARCENVKASSVLSMSDEIIKKLVSLNYLSASAEVNRHFKSANSLKEPDILLRAKLLSEARGYPASLALRNIEQIQQ